MGEATAPTVTDDAFFGGRLILRQPARGHRSGTDAVLLAAAVPRGFAGQIHDAGAGVGAVGLGLALTCPRARITLIENEPVAVALAEANVVANAMADRVAVVDCDLLSSEARKTMLSGRADLVVTNPPFHRPGAVRSSPDDNRRAAHVLRSDDGLADWLVACLACLDDRGLLIVVNAATTLPDMLRVLASRLGDLTMMPVHPRADAPAGRVLLRGRKGSRAPFRIVPPLVLHDGTSFTPFAAAIHAGEAGLDWW